MKDLTVLTELLGLPAIRVSEYRIPDPKSIHIKIESTVKMGICPHCQQISQEQRGVSDALLIRDLDVIGKRCWLVHSVPRYWCGNCQCSFVERVAWRASGYTYTQRYEAAIYQRTRQESLAAIAQSEGLSEDAVQAIFTRWAQRQLSARGYPLVKILCLDEIAPHKGHGSYQLIISAPELGCVLDVLEDRLKVNLTKWFTERGKDWCAHVEFCCADMWEPYHDAAAECLPTAKQVVDRFHVMTNLNEALTKVRRSLQKQANEEAKRLLKGSRWLLLKNPENLSDEQKQQLAQLLDAFPELKLCYQLKEEFRTWFNTIQDRESAAKMLDQWLLKLSSASATALDSFASTVTNWRERILNYFDGRHSNGFAEGVNHKIKLILRRGYGYRNFQHFRLRILAAFS